MFLYFHFLPKITWFKNYLIISCIYCNNPCFYAHTVRLYLLYFTHHSRTCFQCWPNSIMKFCIIFLGLNSLVELVIFEGECILVLLRPGLSHIAMLGTHYQISLCQHGFYVTGKRNYDAFLTGFVFKENMSNLCKNVWHGLRFLRMLLLPQPTRLLSFHYRDDFYIK